MPLFLRLQAKSIQLHRATAASAAAAAAISARLESIAAQQYTQAASALTELWRWHS
jgi:hypothetical protein